MEKYYSSKSEYEDPYDTFYKRLSDSKVVRANLKRAIERSWSLGVPVVKGDDKGIYELYADGTKKYIELY